MGVKLQGEKATSRKVHKAICRHSTEENNRHKGMMNEAKKLVSELIREKVEEELTELKHCPNGMVRLVKGLE